MLKMVPVLLKYCSKKEGDVFPSLGQTNGINTQGSFVHAHNPK